MKRNNSKYYLNAKAKEFVIENYNLAKPFSNFLPGIAGLFGIPMWVFYVNRGQGIISFGTEDKDHSISEFLPANKAYQLCSQQGFRTFIKIKKGSNYIFYEPFQVNCYNYAFRTTQNMRVSSATLRIEELNLDLGLKINVDYFTIPNDSFAGLARQITITNLDKEKKILEVLDGLPVIIPYGTANLFLKKLSRTVEAWMRVENLKKKAPFYTLTVDPTDRPEVVFIKGGNFYLNYSHNKGKADISDVIVDPDVVFNGISDFCSPHNFFLNEPFFTPKRQMTSSKTPCAFGFLKFSLSPKQSKNIYTIAGKANSISGLNSLIPRLTEPYFFAKKAEENLQLIAAIENNVFTASESEPLNLYTQQTYLDNVLRGGLPISLETENKPLIYHVYSRKHGDLERDYNKFLISPTYFSQGNGNYRDMCQNRRLDVWFNPDVKDMVIVDFFNLIQADAYNPLVIKEDIFYARHVSEKDLKKIVAEQDIRRLLEYLDKPFKLGEFLMFLEEKQIRLKVSQREFLKTLLSRCQRDKEAEHGEGFWTDHWTYNLDALENYLAVYPEDLQYILLDKNDFVFFDNNYVVRTRNERYILVGNLPRQLHSVYSNHAKFEAISRRADMPYLVRTMSGEIYKTNLLVKIVCILANKLASLDPFGTGIEMEADKPNWFDSLNGLPGLSGSSSCETMELKRWVKFLLEALRQLDLEKGYKISLPAELHEFLFSLKKIIAEHLASASANKAFVYWDKSNCLKEAYRQKVRFGFSAQDKEISIEFLIEMLKAADKLLAEAVNKSYDKKKNCLYSYFINEVSNYDFIYEKNKRKTDPRGRMYIRPLNFRQKKLPLFLEGFMHLLRIQDSPNACRRVYALVKKSRLFDRKLKMYKITEPLGTAPMEIGRCRVFTPGWLENESIWLHMEYKYLLELLKKGLYKEFYEDFFNCVIAFQEPKRYGRSILENSSFLASSAFPDESLHGNGFVARLSGSTIEFLHMRLLMNVGLAPFSLTKKGELNLEFRPILKSSLFTKAKKTFEYYSPAGKKVGLALPENSYAFNFLKSTLVVYHNPKRKDTFGKTCVRTKRITLESGRDKKIEIKGGTIPHPLAGQIREGKFSRIDIELG